MRSAPSFSALTLTLTVAAALGGCTLVAELDRFESADDFAQDLDFTIERFSPHITHKVFFEVVEVDVDNPDSNVLTSVLVVQPLGTTEASILLPRGIPQGPHAFQFWADNDRNGIVNTLGGPSGADHSWRMEDARDLAVRSRDGSECDAMIPTAEPNCFSHVTPFDILTMPTPPSADFDVRVSLLTPTTGFVELHLVEVDPVLETRAVVAVYHRRGLQDPDETELDDMEITVTIPGVAREGRTYDLDALIDLDGDGEIAQLGETWVQADIAGSDLDGGTREIEADPAESSGVPPEAIVRDPTTNDVIGTRTLFVDNDE